MVKAFYYFTFTGKQVRPDDPLIFYCVYMDKSGKIIINKEGTILAEQHDSRKWKGLVPIVLQKWLKNLGNRNEKFN